MEGDSKPHGQVPWTNYRGKSVGLYKIGWHTYSVEFKASAELL